MVKSKIVGFRKLQKRAKTLDKNLRQKVYSSAVRKAARGSVLREVQSRAPTDTGTTKSAISARANNKPSKHLFGIKISVRDKYRSRRTARRQSGQEYRPDWVLRYYHFQELGTKHHPAQPFLEPGLKAGAGEFLSTLKSELNAGLERHSR